LEQLERLQYEVIQSPFEHEYAQNVRMKISRPQSLLVKPNDPKEEFKRI
jgi:hypothetical protein